MMMLPRLLVARQFSWPLIILTFHSSHISLLAKRPHRHHLCPSSKWIVIVPYKRSLSVKDIKLLLIFFFFFFLTESEKSNYDDQSLGRAGMQIFFCIKRNFGIFILNFIFSYFQYWYDYKLQWEPSEYGEVSMLHVPSDHIWRPDISLYNK